MSAREKSRTGNTPRAADVSGEEVRLAQDVEVGDVLFRVDTAAFAAFLERLDTPAAPNAELLRTMRTTPPWNK